MHVKMVFLGCFLVCFTTKWIAADYNSVAAKAFVMKVEGIGYLQDAIQTTDGYVSVTGANHVRKVYGSGTWLCFAVWLDQTGNEFLPTLSPWGRFFYSI